MTFDSLVPGDRGPLLHQLRRRLAALGFLDETDDESCDEKTDQAIRSFQESRGLDVTGTCDEETWEELTEAERMFGLRPLYLTDPMLRGDDVSALQLQLGILGFNAGRVDGIFGPATADALAKFQRNVDLVVDGVCARDTFEMLGRLARRSSDIPVVGLVEREAQQRSPGSDLGRLRVAVAHQGTESPLAGLIGSDLERTNAVVSVCAASSWSSTASLVNEFEADVCIALQIAPTPVLEFSYFGVPSFESVPGRSLAEHLLRQFPHHAGWSPGVAHGKRLTILRETRCPTVRIRLGTRADATELQSLVAAAISRALQRWTHARAAI
ncbi:MAG: peptidoglycan-binding protein [Microthrixaceae bacterium]